MPKSVTMVLSLTIITSVCGLALGALNAATASRIEEQILINKQLPAAEKVLNKASNDLLADRRTLKVGEDRRDWHTVFAGKIQGEAQPYGVAFESVSDKGFGGDIGIMVGFDVATGDLLGIAVTTLHETPGVGARAATDNAFSSQFRGLSSSTDFRVKQDGGQIDALTGATVTSRAVCDAVKSAVTLYSERADELRQLESSSDQGGDQ